MTSEDYGRTPPMVSDAVASWFDDVFRIYGEVIDSQRRLAVALVKASAPVLDVGEKTGEKVADGAERLSAKVQARRSRGDAAPGVSGGPARPVAPAEPVDPAEAVVPVVVADLGDRAGVEPEDVDTGREWVDAPVDVAGVGDVEDVEIDEVEGLEDAEALEDAAVLEDAADDTEGDLVEMDLDEADVVDTERDEMEAGGGTVAGETGGGDVVTGVLAVDAGVGSVDTADTADAQAGDRDESAVGAGDTGEETGEDTGEETGEETGEDTGEVIAALDLGPDVPADAEDAGAADDAGTVTVADDLTDAGSTEDAEDTDAGSAEDTDAGSAEDTDRRERRRASGARRSSGSSGTSRPARRTSGNRSSSSRSGSSSGGTSR
ncbi:hypothetical protein [Actinomycetospora lemnae]|uniref:Uncharacterized protein n=1 Tax=Actinomycetospora lemnae TaxID=3019891 RepID=A0ABT5SUF3_9PSEU|nr:hypothetical protein [Actinomycetospora sp. DW7H6]MDD7966487.1 hypothetical protein [Actinomycetospora sp. DW7H6]